MKGCGLGRLLLWAIRGEMLQTRDARTAASYYSKIVQHIVCTIH
jgi:hypothetical protein